MIWIFKKESCETAGSSIVYLLLLDVKLMFYIWWVVIYITHILNRLAHPSFLLTQHSQLSCCY